MWTGGGEEKKIWGYFGNEKDTKQGEQFLIRWENPQMVLIISYMISLKLANENPVPEKWQGVLESSSKI